MSKFKIDDVAKETGLTKRTIRYYEEIGLLTPPERSSGGMRLYSPDDIERLKQIVNARDVLGFTLQEITDYVHIRNQFESFRQAYREDPEAVRKSDKLLEAKELVGRQLAMIDQKLEKMNAIRSDTDHMYRRICAAIDNLTS